MARLISTLDSSPDLRQEVQGSLFGRAANVLQTAEDDHGKLGNSSMNLSCLE